MIYIYIFLVANNIGLFKYPAGAWQAFGDFTNIGFFIISIFLYAKERKSLVKTHYRQHELFWLLFTAYFIFSALSSESTSKYGAIGNIRLAYPYFLYFGTIAVLTTRQKIDKFFKAVILFGIIGSILIIWQSLYGTSLLFEGDTFYNIGHWRGQREYIVPGVARVILPPLYIIYMIIIAVFLHGIISKNYKYFPLLIFFLIPVFIGYARSQWIALIFTIVTGLLLMVGYRKTRTSRMVLGVTLFIAAFLISLWVLESIYGGSIISQLADRVQMFFYDINNERGTYGSRLSTIALSLNLWFSSPILGHGTAYWYFINMPSLSDVGFTYVLVTIGLVGLILLLALFVSAFIFGYRTMKLARQSDDARLFLAGMVSLSVPVFLFIAQQYTQHTFSNVLLSLGCGYCAASLNIFNRSRPITDREMNGAAKIETV